MKIISSCTMLFIFYLNMSAETTDKGWSITFNPSEVTAVSGVCALISCTFTYPETVKPFRTIQIKECVEPNNCKDFSKLNVSTNTQNNLKQNIEMLEPDLTKKNCSFIMKDVKKEQNQKEYELRVEGGESYTYKQSTVKIIIQDKPKLKIPVLSEGVEVNLTCSAPFPCPETPPDIKWWILTRKENIIDLKNNITLTTNERLYLSTLTLTPTSDLHHATVICDVSYGRKNIKTCGNLEVKYVKTQILGNAKLKEGDTLSLNCSVESHPPSTDPVWSFRGNTDKLQNQTSAGHLTIDNVGKEEAGIYICEITYMNRTLNTSITVNVIDAATEKESFTPKEENMSIATGATNEGKTNESFTPKGENNATGIVNLIKTLDTSMIFSFVAGMACSAFIFSMILCCWVSCHRGKKHKVPAANPDTDIILQTVQTDVAQTETQEQTPLHDQPDDGTPNPAAAAPDGAEEEDAVETPGREGEYASIDYSLLKNRTAEEEEEREPVDTEYAEIKKDKKKSEDLQDGGDQTQSPDEGQNEGEEELYSNSLMLKSQETNMP